MTDAQLAQLLHEPPPLGRGINTKTPTPTQPLSLGRGIKTKIPTPAPPPPLGRSINAKTPTSTDAPTQAARGGFQQPLRQTGSPERSRGTRLFRHGVEGQEPSSMAAQVILPLRPFTVPSASHRGACAGGWSRRRDRAVMCCLLGNV